MYSLPKSLCTTTIVEDILHAYHVHLYQSAIQIGAAWEVHINRSQRRLVIGYRANAPASETKWTSK